MCRPRRCRVGPLAAGTRAARRAESHPAGAAQRRGPAGRAV